MPIGCGSSRLIDLCRTFVGYFNLVPPITTILVPAVVVASVYVAILAGVQVTIGRSADGTAFSGTCLRANNCALITAYQRGSQGLIAARELAGSVHRIATSLPVNLATGAFRGLELRGTRIAVPLTLGLNPLVIVRDQRLAPATVFVFVTVRRNTGTCSWVLSRP